MSVDTELAKSEHNCSPTTIQDILPILESVIQRYEGKGVLIPVLQSTQNLLGWLPEEAMVWISQRLNIPFSEVAGVVGFYSFFSTHPRGKYLVRVCLGTACYVRGGQEVLSALEKELNIKVGETTPDRQFSLEIGRCFGACGLAPVVMINDKTHQRVRPATVAGLLREYREEDNDEKS